MSNVHILLPRRAQKSRSEWGDAFEALDEPMVAVPVLGWTSAGEPIQMELDYDTVEVPASLVKKETFALRVKGDSMIEEGIQDGDLVVIERSSSAATGESVIVRINNETVTMKKLYIEKGGVRLQPANPTMEPIFLKNEDVEILGIVRAIVRQP